MADGEITGTYANGGITFPTLPDGKTDWAAFARELTTFPAVTVKRGGVDFATGGIVVNSTGANPTIVQSAGPITPELWKHPENATREQLLQMVLQQRAYLKRARKKARTANEENERMKNALLSVFNLSNTVNMYLGLCIQKESLSWAKHAAYYANRIFEVAKKALGHSA